MGRKVGLCLAFSGTNYGQNLQAFATQKIVEKYGFTTEIIDYHSGKNKGITLSYAALIVSCKKIHSTVMSKLGVKKTPIHDAVHQENIQGRKQAAVAFKSKNLHNFVRCNGITELKKKSEDYEAVLVGSDQIWLPDVAVSNFYTLRFAAPGVKRISYATSMGVSSYPDYAKKPAADFWKKIDFLSVREEQAKRIIQEICDVDVTVVADPTYLLTKEEWLEAVPAEKITSGGYVLCYFLGDSKPIKDYARRFANEKGLRLVSILSDECDSNDWEFADEVISSKGPDEFINLIRNSDFVLTDSFHGLAFSIINEKQFLVFYRRRADVKESRNSRIDNIVQTWDIQDRLIQDPEHAEIPATAINYDKVNDRRIKFRADSLAFLEKALGVEHG